MTLRLIHGRLGLVPLPGDGGDGRGGRGGGRTAGGRRRPHWLANLLWYATCRAFYDLRANNTAEIADRMTDLSDQILGHHYNVTEQQAAHCLAVVRRSPFAYGFTEVHVEKGAFGLVRGYVPILVDLDQMHHPVTLIDEDDLRFCGFGMASSAQTVATMLRNEAVVVGLLAGLFDARYTATAATWQQVAAEAEELAAVARTFAV